MVGSIGVILAHEDVSRLLETSGITVSLITAGEHKGELNPFRPLSDEDRAAAQAMCDYFYGLFTAGVARGRGSTAAAVRGGMGQGRVVNASAAVKLGMADGVDTLDGVIGRVASGRYRTPRRGAGAILEVLEIEEAAAGPTEIEQAMPASPAHEAVADADMRRRRFRRHETLAR
jgi:ClpP class serine protease